MKQVWELPWATRSVLPTVQQTVRVSASMWAMQSGMPTAPLLEQRWAVLLETLSEVQTVLQWAAL